MAWTKIQRFSILRLKLWNWCLKYKNYGTIKMALIVCCSPSLRYIGTNTVAAASCSHYPLRLGSWKTSGYRVFYRAGDSDISNIWYLLSSMLLIPWFLESCWANFQASEFGNGARVALPDLQLHLSLGSFPLLTPVPENFHHHFDHHQGCEGSAAVPDNSPHLIWHHHYGYL